MIKVLFLNSEYNGCAYWRMFEPARFLNMTSKKVCVNYFPNDFYQHKPVREWEMLADSHDLIVFGRVSTPESLQTMMVVREISKKPIVVELDDDWSCVDPNNIAYKYWHPDSDCYRLAEDQLRHTDILQVSTMPLKRAMGYRYGKPTWISPNLIDTDKMFAFWKQRSPVERTPGEIRVGWAGSATHYGDFLTFLPAMQIIGEKYPQVKFVFRGMQADFFISEEDKTEIIDGEQRITRKCPLPLNRIEYAHGSQFWDWPKLLVDMDLDIVIVPLDNTKFNRSKSNCRFLEFSSIRIPGVYADVEPYQGTVQNGVNGFLAKNTDQWVKHLSALIESEDLRKEIREAAFASVVDDWSLQNNIGIWEKNLVEMHERSMSMPFVSYFPGLEVVNA